MFQILTSHLLVVLGVLLAVAAIAHMLVQRRTPQSSAAWLLAIVLLPWVGVPLYLMLGGRKLRAMMASKSNVALSMPAEVTEAEWRIEQLLRSLDIPPATRGNVAAVELDGEAAYSALIELIEGAERSITFSTYILDTDEVGNTVLERLTARAEAGVEVRLLLDDLGCLHTGRGFLAPLLVAGGRVARFMPVIHWPFRGQANLRNHRKHVVVDGRRAWSGGRNVSGEYMGPAPDPHRWDDVSFTIEGPAVRTFGDVFESDWAFATGEEPRLVPFVAPLADGREIVQVVPSGPDVPQDALYAAYLVAIYQAGTSIRIVTPYFVPPEELTRALVLAARRGVDVQLLLPARSNHPLTDWARGPHLRDLAEAGVRIHLLPEMIHAKVVTIDHEFAFVGSANIDARSLLLNYELVTAFYDGATLETIEAWFLELVGRCEDWQTSTSRLRRLGEGLAELMSPLL